MIPFLKGRLGRCLIRDLLFQNVNLYQHTGARSKILAEMFLPTKLLSQIINNKMFLELIPDSYVLLALPYDIDQGIQLPQFTSIPFQHFS